MINTLKYGNLSAAEAKLAKAEMPLTEIADALQSDWVLFAREINFTQDQILQIRKDFAFTSEQVRIHLELKRACRGFVVSIGIRW